MSTTTTYVPRDYRRVCDQCGVRYNRSQLHRKLHWIFCDTCDAPGDRIQEEEDAAIARQRPFRILPVPNAKPMSVDSPYDWQAEEAQIFNFVASVAPAATYGGTSDFESAAYAAVYMADVLDAIDDESRPEVWRAAATDTMTTCLDYLLTQFGSFATDSIRYGSIGLVSGLGYSGRAISAGIAFMRGYSVTGNGDYLFAAKKCATFVSSMQAVYSVTGGVAEYVDTSTSLPSGNYLLADVMALWFLSLLAEEVGDGFVAGIASPSDWATTTSQTLGTMIENLTEFAEVGPLESGEHVPGLSVTAPRATYVFNQGTLTGAWTTITDIDSADIAMALRGLYAAEPESETITAILAWLADFGANTDNATPSTNTEQETLDGITGDYDPAVCVATSLTAADPFTESTRALYDLQSLGWLAPALAASDASGLRDSRADLSPGQRFSVYDLSLKYLGPLGRAGLSLQPVSAAPERAIAMDFGDDTSDGLGGLHFDTDTSFTAADIGRTLVMEDTNYAEYDREYVILAVNTASDITVTPPPPADVFAADTTVTVLEGIERTPDVGRASVFGAVYRYVNP